MSPCLAASTSIMPSGAWISWPSMVSWMSLCSGRGTDSPGGSVDRHRPGVLIGDAERDHVLELAGVEALAAPLDLVLELVAELLDHRPDRHRHRVAEHAKAVADDLVLDRGHDVEVHRRGLAGLDPPQHLHGPVGPL